MDKHIRALFPELNDKEIMEGIKKSVVYIRGKIPLRGETTMKFKLTEKGFCEWVCLCGATYPNYVCYCRDGCRCKNVSGAGR